MDDELLNRVYIRIRPRRQLDPNSPAHANTLSDARLQPPRELATRHLFKAVTPDPKDHPTTFGFWNQTDPFNMSSRLIRSQKLLNPTP